MIQIIGGMFNQSVARLLTSQGTWIGGMKKDSYMLDDTRGFVCTKPLHYQISFQCISQDQF
jgi:hypothetical protein